MITLNNSLKVASKILLELQNDERSGKVDAYVMTYDNGREQGYRLNVSREKEDVHKDILKIILEKIKK